MIVRQLRPPIAIGSSCSLSRRALALIPSSRNEIARARLGICIGKTADLECRAVEDTFADLSEMLDDWEQEVDAAGLRDDPADAEKCPTQSLGLHQLGGGGAVRDHVTRLAP